MARRGRPPKEEKVKKGYFLEREEKAVKDYNLAQTFEEKNKIYEDILKPAFITMIESIIRRYNLYGPEEEFDMTFNDTLSFMLTKIGNFRDTIYGYWPITPNEKIMAQAVEAGLDFKDKKQNATDDDPIYVYAVVKGAKTYFIKEVRHFKAYSYCGTVAKNYLLQKRTQFKKKTEHDTPYEEVSDTLVNSIDYSEEKDFENSSLAVEIINAMKKEIAKTLEQAEELQLTENEIKLGNALSFLLEHWEDILFEDGSNKLNKSSVLYFIREDTLLTTKEIRDGMKRYKGVYNIIKKSLLS